MDEIVRLVKMGAGFSEIKAACESAGMNCLIRVYSGTEVPTWPEPQVPTVVGTYDTDRYGELQNFHISSAQPGDVIDHDGRRWKVIVNEFVQGDAWIPSETWFVAEEVQ